MKIGIAFFQQLFDHVFQKKSNPAGVARYRIDVIIIPLHCSRFTPYCGRSSEDYFENRKTRENEINDIEGRFPGGEGLASLRRRPPRIIDIILAAPILLFPVLTQPCLSAALFRIVADTLCESRASYRERRPKSLTLPALEFLGRQRFSRI